MSNFFDKITSSIFSSNKTKKTTSTYYNNDKPIDTRNNDSLNELTEKEIIERREAIVKAAADRSKQWDKKIQTGKKASTVKQINNNNSVTINSDITSEDTLKSIERSKEKERLEAQRLGFNPYAPVCSNSSQASAVTNISNMNINPVVNNTSSKGNINNDKVDISIDESLIDDEIIESVNQALTTLLSNNTDSKETSQSIEASIQTVYKLLNNLNNNRNEIKFRSVRLSNPSIQTKIVNVSGAMDLLLAAGFIITSDESSSSNSTGSEMYLRHLMTDVSVMQLAYTTNRLKEILD